MSDALIQAFTSYSNGDYSSAESLLADCLKANPNQADALHIMGLVKHAQGYPTEARSLIEKAVSESPKNHQFFNNLAIVTSASGDHEAALIAANKAVFLQPKNAESQTTRGLMFQRCSRFDDAATTYRQALQLNPNHLQARLNLGALLLELGDFEASRVEFQKALESAPKSKDAVIGLARSLLELGLYDNAVERLEILDHSSNQSITVQLLLANAYMRKGNTDISVQIMEKLAQQHPENATVWNDLGYALRDQTRLRRAEKALLRALDICPDLRVASENLSQVYLAQGRFEEGWPLYHKRKGGCPAPDWLHNIHSSQPYEDGAKQSHLLVWTEQGLGDEILQASLIRDLSQSASHLMVRCSERLQSLFEHSFPRVSFTSNLIEPDRHSAAQSIGLPLIDTAHDLRKNITAFPTTPGYLTAPKSKTDKLKRKYLRDLNEKALIVGISWHSGNRLYGPQNTILLDQWLPIFDATKHMDRPVIFVPMQFGTTQDYVNSVADRVDAPIVFDPTVDHGGDMLRVASQVAAADVVITTSTTTAQLAGALGRPTIHMTANGLACGWYWMSEGRNTPWYPSMQIVRRTNGIRQQIDGAAQALAHLVGSL